MKILCICDQGNNKSVQFASLLRYKYKADTIPIGIDTTSQETQKMLFDWADYIILTHGMLRRRIPGEYEKKVRLFDVGPDTYPRPFNPVLLAKAKKILEEQPL